MPGLPDLAAEVSAVVKPTWVGADVDSWGVDHGIWSVLFHALPKADTPGVQLSINANRDFDYYLDLGAKLAPLREWGVLIVAMWCTNLGGMSRTLPDSGYDWAQRFDERGKQNTEGSPTEVPAL